MNRHSHKSPKHPSHKSDTKPDTKSETRSETRSDTSSETKDTSPPTEGHSTSRNPPWWTESIESSWKKAKTESLAEWEKLGKGEKKLAQNLAEQAMALGHGAREAFQKLQAWSGELENKLRADWQETGHEAEAAWDKVRETVQHAWERASKTARSMQPGQHGEPTEHAHH